MIEKWELEILRIISKTFPNAFSECKEIYEYCLSFDKTIEILKLMQIWNADWIHIIKIYNVKKSIR